MQFNDVKHLLTNSPDLTGLDDTVRASLLWQAFEQGMHANQVVYTEGTALDDTFCLLLSGTMLVQKAGIIVGEISEGQIFGEMAYFSPLHERSATVRAGSPKASILKFQLTLEELGSPRFERLKKFLGLQAWDRFVSTSKAKLSV